MTLRDSGAVYKCTDYYYYYYLISKLLERLVHKQVSDYLIIHNLLPCLQSAYRKRHSTETAVLKVLGDILLAVDSGDLSV